MLNFTSVHKTIRNGSHANSTSRTHIHTQALRRRAVQMYTYLHMLAHAHTGKHTNRMGQRTNTVGSACTQTLYWHARICIVYSIKDRFAVQNTLCSAYWPNKKESHINLSAYLLYYLKTKRRIYKSSTLFSAIKFALRKIFTVWYKEGR